MTTRVSVGRSHGNLKRNEIKWISLCQKRTAFQFTRSTWLRSRNFRAGKAHTSMRRRRTIADVSDFDEINMKCVEICDRICASKEK